MLRPSKLLLPALLVVVGSLLAGCGVGRTSAEVDRDFRRVATYDAHMLTDDTALLLQTDRPLRTSKWIIE